MTTKVSPSLAGFIPKVGAAELTESTSTLREESVVRSKNDLFCIFFHIDVVYY